MKQKINFKEFLENSSILKNFQTKKSLGQNFLLNLEITDKIAKLANLPDESLILEIGPGLGSLSVSLLNQNPSIKKLILIEKDRELENHLKALEKIHEGTRVIIGDCLKENLIDEEFNHIVGNLPYNISVEIILNYIQNIKIKTMTFLVQKEVGERITAPINNKNYDKLSLLTQTFMKSSLLLSLGPKSFNPAPKVNSVLVRMVRKEEFNLYLKDYDLMKNICMLAFSKRRKLLKNNIGSFYTELLPYLDKERCEDLTPDQLLFFVNLIKEKRGNLWDKF